MLRNPRPLNPVTKSYTYLMEISFQEGMKWISMGNRASAK